MTDKIYNEPDFWGALLVVSFFLFCLGAMIIESCSESQEEEAYQSELRMGERECAGLQGINRCECLDSLATSIGDGSNVIHKTPLRRQIDNCYKAHSGGRKVMRGIGKVIDKVAGE